MIIAEMWQFITSYVYKFVYIMDDILVYDDFSLLDMKLAYVFIIFMLGFVLYFIKFNGVNSFSDAGEKIKMGFNMKHDDISDRRNRL